MKLWGFAVACEGSGREADIYIPITAVYPPMRGQLGRGPCLEQMVTGRKIAWGARR